MDIAYEFSRKRKEFGKHPSFTDSGPIELLSIEPTTEHDEEWEVRPSTEIEIDCIPSFAEHEINTERYIAIDRGMAHKEGGWPKEINTEEFEDKKRYLRKIENDDSFNEIVLSLTKKVESRVKQNNSINMFEEYFANQTDDHSAEPPSAKTITIFRDPNRKTRPVSRVCWHPDSSYRIAAVHCDLSFEAMNINPSFEDNVIDSYIWDITNPNRPYYTIKPVSPITCIAFNKKNTDSFVCGSYNGILGVWDLRKSGNKCVESTVIEKTHNDPIYDVEWIQSRTGTEFVSVSTDGVICWWDARKLGTGPMDQMVLCNDNGAAGGDDSDPKSGGAGGGDDSEQKESTHSTLYGGTSLEYRTDAGATKYLVGTEQGTIISVERKAKKDGDSQKQIKLIYGDSAQSAKDEAFKHHGPIYSCSRNYFLQKQILTVGDWMARVWTEDVQTPIMSTRYESCYLTSGVWSPTRPGVFYVTKQNGELDVWDYYFKGQFQPAYTVKISEQSSLTDVKISLKSDGKYVGVGCHDGSVTILELCKSLYQSPNLNAEKQAMTQLFERETNREKTLQAQKLAARRAAKQAALKKNKQPKKKNNNDGKQEFNLSDFSNIQADFMKFIDANKPEKPVIRQPNPSNNDNDNMDDRNQEENQENNDVVGNQ